MLTVEGSNLKEGQDNPQNIRFLTEKQKKDLAQLRDRLLNLSSRNRSIRLNRLDARWTFDLNCLAPFGNNVATELLQHCLTKNTAKSILPKPTDTTTAELHHKYSLRLNHLYRATTELQREKGLHDLYIGYPFLTGIPIGTEMVIQAPVFLVPVTLEKVSSKKRAPSWVLSSSKEMPPVLNKTLFLALSKIAKLPINPMLYEEAVPVEMKEPEIEKIAELLKGYGLHCETASEGKNRKLGRILEFTMKDLPPSFKPGKTELRNCAVLGHFPQSSNSIQRDYDRLLESDADDLKSILCFLSAEEPTDPISDEIKRPDIVGNFSAETSVNPPLLRQVKDSFLLFPSDSSQDKILTELEDSDQSSQKSQGIVVWGPPGTGKSQTIANLIGKALVQGKSVLLVSQKRAALDVVYDRLAAQDLAHLVALVHDSKTDRKELYKLIDHQTTPRADTEDLSRDIPMDPTSEIERIGRMLRDVFKAYNDDTYGIRLGEIYRKLGGKKDDLIEVETEVWKTKKHSDLSSYVMQLRSLQSFVQAQFNPDHSTSASEFLKHRASFSRIENHEASILKKNLDAITIGQELSDAETIVLAFSENGRPKSRKASLVVEGPQHPSPRLKEFLENFSRYHSFKGIFRFLKPSFWKARSHLYRHLSQARKEINRHAELAKAALSRVLDPHRATTVVNEILSSRHDRTSLRKFTESIFTHFYELKSYDIALQSIPSELHSLIKRLEQKTWDGQMDVSKDWGSLFERSVLALWASEVETRHPAIVLIRSGQVDLLRQQYQNLLSKRVEYSVYQLKEKANAWLATPEGEKFRREINMDVNKMRNVYSLRKLTDKYISRDFYRSLLPIWLVSPEVVSDIFPLRRELFDLVIFDEASQCPVEHGLPAIYRGKQIFITGDEKQLPPNKLFESSLEEDPDGEEIPARDELSLLTLAKKTLRYRSYMLEWHYRSQHQELITFSNEVFYGGRMKIAPNVVPFKPGNTPAITWHSVEGFWKDRTNPKEAQTVIQRIRHFLSQENPPTLGVITFNVTQKDLILDFLEETQANDPEFDELIQQNRKRPIDSQLFVKNIENVQGDEREVIIFSVAYARSEPHGRVHQFFGSLNAHGGENRLNVAITRAIKGIEIVASIDPESDLDVSSSINAGPRILKNYLRYAHAVATENFDRLQAIMNEINPNLQRRYRNASNTFDSPFEEEVFLELQRMGYSVHSQVGQSGFRIDLAIVHPQQPARYLLGIECDGAMFHSEMSSRERDAFRQRFLENRGWNIHRIWSTNWWENREKELQKIELRVNTLLSRETTGHLN